MTIGQRIAQKRNEMGLSQAALGEALNVSRQSVSKWEADAAIPEIDKLITLSKMFGVTVGWLLGVEEDKPKSEESQWEAVLENLQPPKWEMPRWAKVLTAVLCLATAASLVISCMALGEARSYRRSQELLRTQLTAAMGTTQPLSDYAYTCIPAGDLKDADFTFSATPGIYTQGTTAVLTILYNDAEYLTTRCEWDGGHFRAEFSLPIADGYTGMIVITDGDGIQWTQAVNDVRLQRLASDMAWETAQTSLESRSYSNGVLTLTGLEFQVSLPDAFRDVEYPWNRFDLVLWRNGQQVGSIDMMNRSAYSREIDFSTYVAHVYTQKQTFEVGKLEHGDRMELRLEYSFGENVEGYTVIRSWTFVNGENG